MFVLLDDWKQIQDKKILDENILFENLVATNISLNNLDIFVYRAPIKFLFLFFLLTNNGKNFLLFSASIDLVSDYAKGINFLLFSFDINPTDDINLIDNVDPINSIGLINKIDYIDNIGFENSISKIISLENIVLRKSQIISLDIRKSAINIITQTIFFCLDLSKIFIF